MHLNSRYDKNVFRLDCTKACSDLLICDYIFDKPETVDAEKEQETDNKHFTTI